MLGEIERAKAGLIPAHAGKTRGTVFSPTGNGAHPRSRGENDLIRVAGYLSVGSSPLTRGKQVVTAYNTRTGGLIPAHAGKTALDFNANHTLGAHPRSRGENIQTCVQVAADLGSSPLTRGKQLNGLTYQPADRLIPAHAGKTQV